jgi:ribonuclease E
VPTMTTESDPATEPVPQVRTGAPRTAAPRPPSKQRRKRHPAAASRILAAGVATASTFGLVAVLGNRAPASDAAPVASADAASAPGMATQGAAPTTAPPPVIVVRRSYVRVDGGTAAPSGITGGSSASAAAPVTRSAPTTAAPRRTAPAATSSSS